MYIRFKAGLPFRDGGRPVYQQAADGSITRWIAGLKIGQAEAAERLWGRYAERLLKLAQERLGRAAGRISDDEDVALSVFSALCTGAAAGRFSDLGNRDELWWLLLAITRHKAADRVRGDFGRNGRQQRVFLESDLQGGRGEKKKGFRLEKLISPRPTPEFLAMLDEEHVRLLGLLRDEQLRKIAVWRIEGYTVGEIAERLGIARRSVERKLNLIRGKWSRELR